MARSDFQYLPVNHTFTSTSPVWERNFPLEVDAGQSVKDGYLLIMVRDIDLKNHRIQINNKDLWSTDIPKPPGKSNAWLTYMDRIEPNILRPGMNNIQITRVGSDNFEVKDIIVHWREG